MHQTAKRGYREFPSRSEMLDFRLNLKPNAGKIYKIFPRKNKSRMWIQIQSTFRKRCQGSVGSQSPKLSSIFSIHRISFFLKSESDNYVQRLEWRLNYDMAPAQ